MYDPRMVQPMRDEVTSLGVTELTTPEAVDAALGKAEGTALVFINSVCGCAAGNARPALRAVAGNDPKPDHLYTVFAGQDPAATEQARSYFAGQPPSSPCFALLKGGELVGMLHRHNIEGRTAEDVAGDLKAAFGKFCAPE